MNVVVVHYAYCLLLYSLCLTVVVMGSTKTENGAVEFPFQHNSSRGENAIPLAVDVIGGHQVCMTSGSRWYARVRG